MQKITLALMILITSFGFSQNAPIDFETAGNGADWSWSVFENDSNPALEVVANPYASGINTSSSVAKFTALQTGQPWAGCESTHGEGIGTFTINATNSTIKILVYKTVISDVGIKIVTNTGWSAGEIKASNTVINEWEELSFDFSSQMTPGDGTYDQIVVFPDFSERTSDNVIYFDNINFSEQIVVTDPEPTDAAATPPARETSDVISIFSDAYSNITGTDFNPNWGQSTIVTTEDIVGNPTLKYASFNYQGTVLGSTQDASLMQFLHVDMWTADATDLKVTPINASGTPTESLVSLSPIVAESWNSFDIPLTDFTNSGMTLNELIQMKFDGQGGTNPSNIYLDNIYFYKEVTVPGTDATLSDLLINGTTVESFSPGVLNYEVKLPEGTTIVPTVTATTNDANALAVITQATEIPGTTTIVVTSEDASVELSYTVTFSIENLVELPIDFETGTYDFIDFDGGTATVIANPQSTVENNSASVAQIVRNGGATWGGSKLVLSDNIDFSTINAFSMKVYSTRADVPVLFKLEGENAATEVLVNTSLANQWETMTWDFTGAASGTYNELVFMFDFGTVGDSSANSIFLFDDIEQLFGGTQIDLPVDFEGSTVNYELTDFGGNLTQLGQDPADETNIVAISTKTTGAASWAGTTIGTPAGFKTNIPFSLSDSKMSVRVWSPESNTPIRLKVEDSNDPTHTCETETNTTVSEDWEVIEFDFINQAPGTELLSVGLEMGWTYNMASIFFNFGIEGANEIYYWDDVVFGGTPSKINDLEGQVVLVNVYPNPSKGVLNLKFDLDAQDMKIDILNFRGQKVIHDQLSVYPGMTKLYDLSEQNNGIYLIRIYNNNISIDRKVVIK